MRYRRANLSWGAWETTTRSSIDIANPIPGESYEVQVRASDVVGNQALASSATVTVPIPKSGELPAAILSTALSAVPAPTPASQTRQGTAPLAPSLAATPTKFSLIGALADADAPKRYSDGLMLGNASNGLPSFGLVPSNARPSAGVMTSDKGVRYTDARPATDTTVRGMATGLRVSELLRDANAAHRLGWHVNIAQRHAVLPIAPNMAAVVIPRDTGVPTTWAPKVSHGLRSVRNLSDTELSNPRWQLDSGQSLLESAQAELSDSWLLGLVIAPRLTDGQGRRVPGVMSVSGDEVSFTPRAGAPPARAETVALAASASKCTANPDRDPDVFGGQEITVRAYGGIFCNGPKGYKKLSPKDIIVSPQIMQGFKAVFPTLQLGAVFNCPQSIWCYHTMRRAYSNNVTCPSTWKFYLQQYILGTYINRRNRPVDVPRTGGGYVTGYQSCLVTP